jgi:hypothetical protein
VNSIFSSGKIAKGSTIYFFFIARDSGNVLFKDVLVEFEEEGWQL